MKLQMAIERAIAAGLAPPKKTGATRRAGGGVRIKRITNQEASKHGTVIVEFNATRFYTSL